MYTSQNPCLPILYLLTYIHLFLTNSCQGIGLQFQLFLHYFNTYPLPNLRTRLLYVLIIPLFSVFFFSSCLWVICFSMIGSVTVIWLARSQHDRPIPWVIKHALTGCIGRWLCLSNYVKNVNYVI